MSRPNPSIPAPSIAPSTSAESESTQTKAHDKGLDVSVLKELARTALVESLNAIQGAKTLVLDPGVAGPLGLVTDVSLLKHQAVDKMFWLEAGPISAPTKNIVWLCRPKRGFMKIIADQIKEHQSSPSSSSAAPHSYTILFVPRCTALCRAVLEKEGVMGDVTVSEYKLEFIPLEEDVLSLELEHVAKEIFLDGDDTAIYYSSLALMTFQRAFGLFPRIIGKGDASKRLASLLLKHRPSSPAYSDLSLSESVDSLIILDRAVDWVTPMMTQLTYEGLLDEFVGIKNSHIEVDPALLQAGPAPLPTKDSTSSLLTTPLVAPKKKKHPLNSSSPLYADLRDLNFAVVGTRLNKAARKVEGDLNKRKDLASVKEMREFVGRLGGLQEEQSGVRIHTGLSEILMPITRGEDFSKTLEIQQNLIAGYEVSSQLPSIEDLMNQQLPPFTILRAVVLLSLTTGGIKQRPLEAFKREFLQVNGYHHLPLFLALESLGLLNKSPSPPASTLPFPQLRKALRLFVDDTDDLKPSDVSYTYSGYAPLSVRLVQCVVQKPVIMSGPPPGEQGLPKAHAVGGWKGFEDVVKAVPGATFDEGQKDGGDAGSHQIRAETNTTVVFFLGGCTFTEIAALRWMSQQTKGRRFLIATTGIINGTSLLEDFGYPAPAELKPLRP